VAKLKYCITFDTMKAKLTTKAPDIRIPKMKPATFKKVVKLAAKENRTVAYMSEFLIEAGLKSLSNLETV
jgi:hypothetical protein